MQTKAESEEILSVAYHLQQIGVPSSRPLLDTSIFHTTATRRPTGD
jgi:hypothetical protein